VTDPVTDDRDRIPWPYRAPALPLSLTLTPPMSPRPSLRVERSPTRSVLRLSLRWNVPLPLPLTLTLTLPLNLTLSLSLVLRTARGGASHR
jgi:hypothetical protein